MAYGQGTPNILGEALELRIRNYTQNDPAVAQALDTIKGHYDWADTGKIPEIAHATAVTLGRLEGAKEAVWEKAEEEILHQRRTVDATQSRRVEFTQAQFKHIGEEFAHATAPLEARMAHMHERLSKTSLPEDLRIPLQQRLVEWAEIEETRLALTQTMESGFEAMGQQYRWNSVLDSEIRALRQSQLG